MSSDEYRALVRASFESQHLDGQDGFVFSKEALIDGLTAIEEESIYIEYMMSDENLPEYNKDALCYVLRKTQVIANILKRCLDGVRIQTRHG